MWSASADSCFPFCAGFHFVCCAVWWQRCAECWQRCLVKFIGELLLSAILDLVLVLFSSFHISVKAYIHTTSACGLTVFDEEMCERLHQKAWQLCLQFIHLEFIQPNKHESQFSGQKKKYAIFVLQVENLHPMPNFRCKGSLVCLKLSNLLEKICDACCSKVWV